ncbi:hypothetical protein BJ138DRAFT_1118945 [Hygrophoropsis aurantiaca]|uniref:Uncharacterized protein n=1 Tax=Hygrophoropsis aurantiaca TaxID=72124 RepID=A0ACB7ZUP2_9AGAM|nr:hypothetical protein BJ138DRAFT_1118945 [Hygrophoropsis aurantiaca]
MPDRRIINIIEGVKGQGFFMFIERNMSGTTRLNIMHTRCVMGSSFVADIDVRDGVLVLPDNFVSNSGGPVFATIIHRVKNDPNLTVVFGEWFEAMKLLTDTVCRSANYELQIRF